MGYESTLLDLAKKDDRIVVMTAENRAAIRNVPAALGARFLDVGICEQTMIGAAAGLALRGRLPIAHALATFLTLRAFEFVRTDVGIAGLPVKLVGAVPGFLSDGNGPTHQALEDVSLMRGVPNMEVYCPADEADLVAMLPALFERPRPCYIRFCAMKPVVDHAPFVAGKAETFGEGRDVAILTYGFLLREAIEARAELEARGVRARVVHMRSLKPIDEAAILAAARETKLVAVVEDHFETGGLTSIVAETCLRARVTCRATSLSLRERWFKPGRLDEVLAHEGFTGSRIASRITEELAA